MKEVVIIRMEDVLVKEFDRLASYQREMKKALDALQDAGLTEEQFNVALRRVEDQVASRVKERERVYYDKEFERSKVKKGVKEFFDYARLIGVKKGLELGVVSSHLRSKVWQILRLNGLQDIPVVELSEKWIGERDRSKLLMLSNREDDTKLAKLLGIQVCPFHIEDEGVSGFMKTIGLKQCA